MSKALEDIRSLIVDSIALPRLGGAPAPIELLSTNNYLRITSYFSHFPRPKNALYALRASRQNTPRNFDRVRFPRRAAACCVGIWPRPLATRHITKRSR